MDLSKFLEQVLVTIVLFEQKPEQSVAYVSLKSALGMSEALPEIFLYDNSSVACPPQNRLLIYRHDPANSGVSKAYNEALKIAVEKNRAWMLFLDQDTNVEEGLFSNFSSAIIRFPDVVAFVPEMRDEEGQLSPFRFALGQGKRIAADREVFRLDKFRFINSGLLVRREAFARAGGYDENIPLDFSDIAFGERLQRVADHFVVVPVCLKHSFSGSKNHRTDVEGAISRYNFFCKGAINMGRAFGPFYVYVNRAFLRGCRLTYRFRSLRFIKVFLQHAMHG
jgi:GT2 family glycosyltransferase